MAVSIEDLATHGVIKPDELRGLSPQETEEFDAYQYIIKTLVQLYPKSMPGSQKDPPYNKDSEYMMILTTKDLVWSRAKKLQTWWLKPRITLKKQ